MDFSVVAQATLFSGVSPQELQAVLPCLGARSQRFERRETIYRAGDVVTQLGIVLNGSVQIVVNHHWGDREVFGHMGPGQIFAETYSAIPGHELLVDVVATEPTEILFLDTARIITPCSHACPVHQRLIHNLVRLSAQKNLALSRRMMHTAPKTIRARVLSYLSERSVETHATSFSIPYSRQELAEYLNVDRSALSAELSRMQHEGLISFTRNRFSLYSTDSLP